MAGMLSQSQLCLLGYTVDVDVDVHVDVHVQLVCLEVVGLHENVYQDLKRI